MPSSINGFSPVGLPIYTVNSTQAILADGTVSTPSLRFQNSPSSGVFLVNSSSACVAVSTNGVQAAMFTPSGTTITGQLTTGNLNASNVTASNLVVTPGLRITTGASSGSYLVSDANGNASWSLGGAPALHTHYRTSWSSFTNASPAAVRLYISIQNNALLHLQGRMLISNIDPSATATFRLNNQSLYGLSLANVSGMCTDFTILNTEYGVLKYNWRIAPSTNDIELLLENTQASTKFNLAVDFSASAYI